jgi:hypothetical protein
MTRKRKFEVAVVVPLLATFAATHARSSSIEITALRKGSVCRNQHGDPIRPAVVPTKLPVTGDDDTLNGIVKIKVAGVDCYLFEAEAGFRPYESCPTIGQGEPVRISGTRGPGGASCASDHP